MLALIFGIGVGQGQEVTSLLLKKINNFSFLSHYFLCFVITYERLMPHHLGFSPRFFFPSFFPVFSCYTCLRSWPPVVDDGCWEVSQAKGSVHSALHSTQWMARHYSYYPSVSRCLECAVVDDCHGLEAESTARHTRRMMPSHPYIMHWSTSYAMLI